MGNNIACKVVGIETVKVKLTDESTKIFTDVRHVPELKRNLLSLGMTEQVGCSFKGEGGTLKISKGSLQITKGIRKNGLYRLQGETIMNPANLISVSKGVSTKLWH